MATMLWVEPGEGIAGGQDVGARTTTLLSCMGIAMVNPASKQGGLYHYSAGSLGNPGVQRVILQMANDLKVTEVRLTQAWKDPMFPSDEGSNPEDVAQITTFLQGLKGATLGEMEPALAATLYWEDGKAVYNGKDFSAPGRSGITTAVEETYSVEFRKLEGSVSYYGANCKMRNRWSQVVTTGAPTGGPPVETKATP
jgi:hypothetical protein